MSLIELLRYSREGKMEEGLFSTNGGERFPENKVSGLSGRSDIFLLPRNFNFAPITRLENLRNCKELHDAGFTKCGVYTITPDDGKGSFQVLCDQHTACGGWTVVQKRFDGSVSFNRSWAEYVGGFGTLGGEFWLGLEKIHRLTKGNPSPTLRFDLGAPDGTSRFEEYKAFTVGDAASKYVVSFGAASGE